MNCAKISGTTSLGQNLLVLTKKSVYRIATIDGYRQIQSRKQRAVPLAPRVDLKQLYFKVLFSDPPLAKEYVVLIRIEVNWGRFFCVPA